MSFRFLAVSLFFLAVLYGLSQWNLRHTRKYPKYVVSALDEMLFTANNMASESLTEAPMMALAHSSEALGMLNSIRALAPEDDLEKLFSKKYQNVQTNVRKARKLAANKARVLCGT